MLHDLIGTARDNWFSIFKTFGLLLVTAILVAAAILRVELKRRAEIGQFQALPVTVKTGMGMSIGEYAYNAAFGFVLGYKFFYALQNMDLLKQNAADVLLTLQGSWFGGLIGAVGMAGFYWLRDRSARQEQVGEKVVNIYPADRIGDITVVAAISGVAGAKIFALIEDLPAFFADPVGSFFSGSGLAIYGGLIGGFIGVALYLRSKKIPLVPVMDAVAPALIVAYGVGRLGCHLAGDGDWGIAAGPQPSWWFLPDWVWAYDYPHNVLRQGESLADCVGVYCTHLAPLVYPTPLYEIVAALLIGAILWALRKRLTALPGMLFSIYLVFNGVERYWIEKIRVNERYEVFANFTQAEIIAICFVLVGVIWGAWIWRQRRKAVDG